MLLAQEGQRTSPVTRFSSPRGNAYMPESLQIEKWAAIRQHHNEQQPSSPNKTSCLADRPSTHASVRIVKAPTML